MRGTPIVHNGVVYIGCYDNNLYALDAKKGSFLWKYATEGGIPTRPAAQDDVVFVASEDHHLHAVTADKGKVVSKDEEFRCAPCRKDGCDGSKRSKCLEVISVEDALAAIHESVTVGAAG